MTEEKIEQLENLTKDVHGWTAPKERAFLYNIAKLIKKDGVIVEIGSWKGKSTIWMAYGVKAGNKAKIYAIDPFTGSSEHQSPGKKIWTFDEFKNNIDRAGVADIITPLISTSETAAKNWTKPIDFLFIDGAHEYEEVKKDFLLWSEFLVDGGIIALHDTSPYIKAILENWPIFGLPGPKKIAFKHVLNSTKFKNVGLVGSIVYATKCSDNRSMVNTLQSQICKNKN